MRKWIYCNKVNKISQWLFPVTCLSCQQRIANHTQLCAFCVSDFTCFSTEPSLNLLHRPDIQKLFKLKHIDSLLAIDWYKPPLSLWLKQLKFANQQHYAVAIRQLISKQLTLFQAHPKWQQPDKITPIPLAQRRYFWRGYNQVTQVWQPCIPTALYHPKLLMRQRNTKAQSRLNLTERKRNLNAVFRVTDLVQDQTIVLIDDIMTTGATLDSAALALKNAEAKHVFAWVCCLTPLQK